jgi:hypothetical protein
LLEGAILDASAKKFSNAGKGGTISLEAGAAINGVEGGGVLSIGEGSQILLAVEQTPREGQFSGTLHLRAPRSESNDEISIDPILGTISGASSISIEGFRIYDLSTEDSISRLTNSLTVDPIVLDSVGDEVVRELSVGLMNSLLRDQVHADSTAFLTVDTESSILERLFDSAPRGTRCARSPRSFQVLKSSTRSIRSLWVPWKLSARAIGISQAFATDQRTRPAC